MTYREWDRITQRQVRWIHWIRRHQVSLTVLKIFVDSFSYAAVLAVVITMLIVTLGGLGVIVP